MYNHPHEDSPGISAANSETIHVQCKFQVDSTVLGAATNLG